MGIHNFIVNENGDTSLLRQWHQKFVTAIGQKGGYHGQIINNMVRDIDFGKALSKPISLLWSVLIDKAKMEAFDGIMAAKE